MPFGDGRRDELHLAAPPPFLIHLGMKVTLASAYSWNREVEWLGAENSGVILHQKQRDQPLRAAAREETASGVSLLQPL